MSSFIRLHGFHLKSAGTSLLMVVVLLACTTPTSNKQGDLAQEPCAGQSAQKSYVFTLASYDATPKGLPVEQVDSLSKQRDQDIQSMTNWLVPYLLSFYLEKQGSGVVHRENWLPGPAASNLVKLDLIRTGGANFVLCNGETCDGLIDPITHHLVERVDIKNNRGGCTVYYAPEIESYGKSELSNLPHCSHGHELAMFDQWKFREETGFNAGRFIADHYFSVPERDRAAICQIDGQEPDCMKLPDWDRLKDSQKNDDLANRYPHEFRFLMNTYNFTDLATSIPQVNRDPHKAFMWADAVARAFL